MHAIGHLVAVALRRSLLWSAIVLCSAAAVADSNHLRDLQLRDVSGRALRPFAAGTAASIVFFVATDCPVSNGYAPEIQRVCREYGARGVACSLVYEDIDTVRAESVLNKQVSAHLSEYGYRDMPATIDRQRSAAGAVKATVTPTAVVVDPAGELRYRGRIDNLYAALGKTRQQVTSHDVRDALDAVLSGRRVAQPDTEPIGCYITDPALLRTHSHE
jgi:thiol-disulfide isomerase/thioredoxin